MIASAESSLSSRAANGGIGLRRMACDPLNAEFLERSADLGQLLLPSIAMTNRPVRHLR
jgi:hypothetical protein